VADPVQHAKGRLRKKACEDFPQRNLMLDLIAIADNYRHRHCHGIKSGADVIDHAVFGPCSLCTGHPPQCVLDHPLPQFG
jgi:hypothetical protein